MMKMKNKEAVYRVINIVVALVLGFLLGGGVLELKRPTATEIICYPNGGGCYVEEY